jgi:hypothetical protein
VRRLERSQDATAGTDLGRLRHRGPGRLCGAGRTGVSAPTPLSPARRSWSWSTPSNQRAGSSTCRYTTRWRWFGYGRSSWQVAVQPGCSAAVCHSRSQGPMNQRPQPWIGQPHGNHGWPGSWRASRVFGWTWWTSRHGDADQHRAQASTSLEGPVEVPQNEQCGPLRTSLLELMFERLHSQPTLGG